MFIFFFVENVGKSKKSRKLFIIQSSSTPLSGITFAASMLISSSVAVTLARKVNEGVTTDCEGGTFYGDRRTRGIVEGTLFQFIPGIKKLIAHIILSSREIRVDFLQALDSKIKATKLLVSSKSELCRLTLIPNFTRLSSRFIEASYQKLQTCD